ncbi:acetoacetate--CoA ligase [Bailinhaonella thermotolerans]|uniref:Acetoacetate--CoA ligase n=1 Tax=Bailinhaonella thermotolerans TaxID=1070861 RepID=A0A3A4A7R7_9ACTN|nr:acetoacetate--CoA ligase [Bailinhaonella thermotolerans]RJL22057.1 acetoacetate--CoA ligase [Bailinhaonella thermotolerans]
MPELPEPPALPENPGPPRTPAFSADPEPLYSPGPDAREGTQLGRFLDWLAAERGLRFDDWAALHAWSVSDLAGFWSALWEFFQIKAAKPYDEVVSGREMPGAVWFRGALLNYAEHMFGEPEDAGRVAVLGRSQTRPDVTLTFGELREQVARARAGLRRLGVGRGDRVVAYLPNIPETLVAFLATASLGAVWASCAPEFGAPGVIDRFGQVEPTVLLVVDGYRYGERHVDRRGEVAALREGLPTVRHVVHVPYGGNAVPDAVTWDDLLDGDPGPLEFEHVPFDHPLFVLFTSGTTGKPKAIVHGHGGILIEHFKNGGLSWDLKPGDRMLWFSTTAWMLWNALVSALLLRASIVMLDGDPAYPDIAGQWRTAGETGATLVGVSPAYLMTCRKQGVRPAEVADLSRLNQLGVAGSPLPVEGYHWVHEQFGGRVLLNVGCGGTDLCSAIIQGSPLQPVWAGEISGPCLGVDAKAYDPDGNVVVGELGELVITAPMPSMPVGFWGDEDGSRYRAAYFEDYPGVWRHGDWVRFLPTGSAIITGRSDATLNRGGVRLGTAEFYRVVEELPEIDDSLIVHLEDRDGGLGELLLFVRPADGVDLDDALRDRLRLALRTALSPRHVPDRIIAVASVPRNRTGKKVEVPVKRILLGEDPDKVASRESLTDPSSLDAFVALAGDRA